MTKRIAALLCALLLLFAGSIPVCALIAVEDENGVVHYSTDKPTEQPSAFRQWTHRVLARVKDFWKTRGVLTVAILLIVAVLGTVVVLTIEDEKKKKQQIDSKPKKNHKE